jgi:hypothetical protein
LKYKIQITLSYDDIPLDAPVLLFIDIQYLKTVYTVKGYVEEMIDVEGKYIIAHYEGDDDYEETYAKKELPVKVVVTPIGLGLGFIILFKNIDRALIDEHRERIGLSPLADMEYKEIVEMEEWFRKRYPKST